MLLLGSAGFFFQNKLFSSRSWSGSKLFAQVISRRHKSLLARTCATIHWVLGSRFQLWSCRDGQLTYNHSRVEDSTRTRKRDRCEKHLKGVKTFKKVRNVWNCANVCTTYAWRNSFVRKKIAETIDWRFHLKHSDNAREIIALEAEPVILILM